MPIEQVKPVSSLRRCFILMATSLAFSPLVQRQVMSIKHSSIEKTSTWSVNSSSILWILMEVSMYLLWSAYTGIICGQSFFASGRLIAVFTPNFLAS
jgi:hypothetical protein